MTIETALNNDVFLTYLAIVGGLLATAGLLLGILTVFGKNVASAWPAIAAGSS